MAEGGDYGYDNPALDFNIDHDDDDDDDYEDQEVNTTRPFRPGASLTPYHDADQHEMQTMHEQSGLPDTSYEWTPFLRISGSIGEFQKQTLIRQKLKKAIDTITGKFNKANFEKIKIRRGRGKKWKKKIVAVGPKGGEYKIMKEWWSTQALRRVFFRRF